jgi:hypothetical protein
MKYLIPLMMVLALAACGPDNQNPNKIRSAGEGQDDDWICRVVEFSVPTEEPLCSLTCVRFNREVATPVPCEWHGQEVSWR